MTDPKHPASSEGDGAAEEPSLQDRYAPDNACFGCGPANAKGLRLKSHVAADGTVVATFRPEVHHEAFPGVLNGGIIGALLDCKVVLEGTVRRAGNQLRITAQLTSTEDGHPLWSQRYDRPYKDLFALQDEIAQAVATALQPRLLPNAHAAAQNERPPSGSIEAYNAYLQGKFDASRGTDPGLATAIERFTAATRLDPRYAAAWAKLGATWVSNTRGSIRIGFSPPLFSASARVAPAMPAPATITSASKA